MRVGRILILLLLIGTVGHKVQAQTLKSVTPDSVAYFEEMSNFFITADKKRGKAFMENFELVWYGGKLSETQRTKVYEISNAMLKKRMRPYPQFETFLFSLVSFVESGQSEESYQAWMVSLEKLVGGRKKKDFETYLKISSDLFSDNILYRSASTTWQSNNSDYQFVYDSLPKIIFPDLNLRCFAKRDSSVIYNTKGVYYPTKGYFVGDGGKITWERVGLDVNETYGIIKDYQIRVKTAGYSVDSVIFYNSFFAQPLLGKVSEKVLAKSGKQATYPRFESYDQRLQINNIVDGVDYDGGFTVHGGKLLGSGTDETPALLVFYRNDESFLIASSKTFLIKPDKIASPVARVVIYLEDDSITHPGLNLKFIRDSRLLTLLREEEGISRSPYYNSYHNIDMEFEALYWKIDDPLIEMGALFGSTNLKANFKSVNYYKEATWQLLQGMDAVHPLIRIKDLTKQLDSREFYAQELANSMRITLPQIIPMLINLSNLGFLSYDPESKYVIVNDKTYEYILARAGKTDYDIIEFKSEVKGENNASLSLLNFDLTIRGVRTVNLSDSQRVAVVPANQQVILQKNRNFSYSGLLAAGKTTYYGKEFSFDYDEFKVNLINVDSMRMRVLSFEKRADGYRRPVQVTTVIEGVKGVISIDNPFNKSGIQDDYPDYPILTCTKKSYCFYDKSSIQKGVYNRDKFYFQLEPFTMDSLDTYSNEGLGFDGTFVSAGIFEDFEERLTLQKDYSLGFIRTTPSTGSGLYGDKGDFNDTISLSHDGLKGNGTVNFLTSTSISRDFTFFPDSTTGIARFTNREASGKKIEFPEVDGEAAKIIYLPHREALIAKKTKSDFKFFGDQARLDGTLVLRPKGMIGKGSMEFEGAELVSKRFDYGAKVIDSDTAAFKLNSLDLGEAFSTDNVKAHIDFDERVGEFTSNGEETFVEFPVNKYICYMDVFKWFMDDNDIELESSKQKQNADLLIETGGVELPGSNFYSVHPDQDSLNFIAPKARYDLDTYIIHCDEVPFINVADANVSPDSGYVKISKDADMGTLKKAGIVANNITKYHNIYNASVNIESAKIYTGSGDYDYVDENKMKQTIHFNNIQVDTTLQTVASGKVLEEDDFTLSPNFAYKGEVFLAANNKYLNFRGGTRISHTCPGVAKSWMNFEAEIDPEDIFIPVSGELKNENGDPIGAGVVLNSDSVGIYSTFLSIKKNGEHPNVITADGYLYFDKKKREYQISNKDKLKENTLPGNFVSLNIESCIVGGNGKMSLGTNTGQIKFMPIGNITHNPSENKVDIRAAVVVDFLFNENAAKQMAEFINKYPDLEAIDFAKAPYEQSLREVMGLEAADRLIAELSLNTKIKKFPKELEHTFYLADVSFKWDPNKDAYISVGKIGIGSIYKEQVYKYVNGNIMLKKKRGGDELHIYLECDANNYYYFTYRRGIMQVWSSDAEFNTTVKETKDDDRKSKGEKGDEPYSFSIGTKSGKDRFLRDLDRD